MARGWITGAAWRPHDNTTTLSSSHYPYVDSSAAFQVVTPTPEGLGATDPEIANLRQQYLNLHKDMANGMTAEQLRARIAVSTKENSEIWANARLLKIAGQLKSVTSDFPDTAAARTAERCLRVLTEPTPVTNSDELDSLTPLDTFRQIESQPVPTYSPAK